MSIEIPEFVTPSWLNDQDAKTINDRMMARLPDGFDRTEGGFLWDLTMPAALEKSEALQFHLTEALKQTNPLWATGTWLDLCAEQDLLKRKAATYSTGNIVVSGQAGLAIPKGFLVATAAASGRVSKVYATTEDAVIGSDGSVTIPIQADLIGTGYTAAEDTVTLMIEPRSGITAITNPEAVTGGADEETDDDLRQRILEIERIGTATGCDADYIRWAREVPGVGVVIVDHTNETRGIVRLIISDENNEEANAELRERVYNYIMSPNDRSLRVAPAGASLIVDTYSNYEISIIFDFTAAAAADEAEIIDALEASVRGYFAGDARESKKVSYNRIRALIEGADSVTAMTRLEITAVRDPEATVLGPTQYITVPEGYYYPELSVFERRQGE